MINVSCTSSGLPDGAATALPGSIKLCNKQGLRLTLGEGCLSATPHFSAVTPLQVRPGGLQCNSGAAAVHTGNPVLTAAEEKPYAHQRGDGCLLRCCCCRGQVQSGVARTGKWWGHQHMLGEDEQPDIMTFAKGIAAGFPFAGLAMKDSVKAVRSTAAQCPSLRSHLQHSFGGSTPFGACEVGAPFVCGGQQAIACTKTCWLDASSWLATHTLARPKSASCPVSCAEPGAGHAGRHLRRGAARMRIVVSVAIQSLRVSCSVSCAEPGAGHTGGHLRRGAARVRGRGGHAGRDRGRGPAAERGGARPPAGRGAHARMG